MNKNEAKLKIENMEKELEQLKQYVEQDDKANEIWEPKEGEAFWVTTSYGTVEESCYFYNDGFMMACSDIGNIYKTREEAEKRVRHLKIKQQLKSIAFRLNNGVEIDWNDDNQTKYSFGYDFADEELRQYSAHYISAHYIKCTGSIYCLDYDFKDIAVSEIGEADLLDFVMNGE